MDFKNNEKKFNELNDLYQNLNKEYSIFKVMFKFFF